MSLWLLVLLSIEGDVRGVRILAEGSRIFWLTISSSLSSDKREMVSTEE